MGWADCERLLLEAKAPRAVLRSGDALLFPGGAPQVSRLALGLGPLDELLQLRLGEVCEVYGPPAGGKTQLGLTVALCAQRPVLFVSAKDEPRLLAQRLQQMASCREVRRARRWCR